MADLYDAILVNGNMRYRLNRVFVKEDKVPETVKEILTTDNIVDENGTVIVEQKNDEAKKDTANAAEEADKAEDPKESEGAPEDEKSEDKEPADAEEPAEDEPTTPSPSGESSAPEVDDSANENGEEDEDADPGKDPTGEDDKPRPPAPDVAAADEESDAEARAKEFRAAKEKASQRARRAPQPVDKFRSRVPQSNPGMDFPRYNGKTVDIFDMKTPHVQVKLVGGKTVPLSQKNFDTKTDAQIIKRLKELGIQTIDFDAIEQEQTMNGSVAGNGILMEEEEQEDDIKLG